jgi:hypothetical protein
MSAGKAIVTQALGGLSVLWSRAWLEEGWSQNLGQWFLLLGSEGGLCRPLGLYKEKSLFWLTVLEVAVHDWWAL